MASLVVGITGKKRSGKDTFAARLLSHHGFTQVRMVDPLRAVLKAQDPIVDWVGDDVRMDPVHLTDVLGPDDDWEIAKELPEVRRLMQALGTEGGREILGQDIWVDAARKRIDAIPGPVVITDVRFPNEADLVGALGGVLVRVTRPGLESTDSHPSETALDAWVANLNVLNDAAIEDLHDEADELISFLA